MSDYHCPGCAHEVRQVRDAAARRLCSELGVDGLNFTGEYEPGRDYMPGDVARYGRMMIACRTPHTATDEPGDEWGWLEPIPILDAPIGENAAILSSIDRMPRPEPAPAAPRRRWWHGIFGRTLTE